MELYLCYQKLVISPAVCTSQDTDISTQLPLRLSHDNIVNAVPFLASRVLPGVLVDGLLFKKGIGDGELIKCAEG